MGHAGRGSAFRTGSAGLSRDLNRVAVLRLIGASGPIARTHIAQMLGYLNITGLEVALLINFKESKLDWKRVVAGPPYLVSGALPTQRCRGTWL